MYENYNKMLSEIKEYQLMPDFNRKERICHFIKKINQNELIEFYKNNCISKKHIELQTVNEQNK